MQRISNSNHSGTQESIVQYVYVEVPAEPTMPPQGEIRYVDREVQVPGETIVVQAEAKDVDFSVVNGHIRKHEDRLSALTLAVKQTYDELDMQRRALIAVKMQRDVDRKRRLQLIQRLKRELDNNRKLNFKFKLVAGFCALLSILTIVIK